MGSIRLYGSTSGYLELQAPAVAPDAVLTLPSDSVQPGLVHLHTENFSGVSSVSIDDVFSAEYDNYRIMMTTTPSSNAFVYARLRYSGTDENTVNSYVSQQFNYSATTVGGNRYTSDLWYFSQNNSTLPNQHIVEMAGPFATKETVFTTLGGASYSGAYILIHSGTHNQVASYDGITVKPPSGTFTGTIRIYGYRNS